MLDTSGAQTRKNWCLCSTDLHLSRNKSLPLTRTRVAHWEHTIPITPGVIIAVLLHVYVISLLLHPRKLGLSLIGHTSGCTLVLFFFFILFSCLHAWLHSFYHFYLLIHRFTLLIISLYSLDLVLL